LDAAFKTDLNLLCLLHEFTVISLAYGIYKMDSPNTNSINIVFIDVGHSNTQGCVVAFIYNPMSINTIDTIPYHRTQIIAITFPKGQNSIHIEFHRNFMSQ